MAESKRQPRLRCQIHFQPDRHVRQKLSQVYHWLVPQSELGTTPEAGQLSTAQDAKERSHLRPSLF